MPYRFRRVRHRGLICLPEVNLLICKVESMDQDTGATKQVQGGENYMDNNIFESFTMYRENCSADSRRSAHWYTPQLLPSPPRYSPTADREHAKLVVSPTEVLTHQCHHHASGQKGGAEPHDGPHRRAHPEPAVWIGAQSVYPIPDAVPRWGLPGSPVTAQHLSPHRDKCKMGDNPFPPSRSRTCLARCYRNC